MPLGSKCLREVVAAVAAAAGEEAPPFWMLWEWWRISRTAGIGAATRFRWVPEMLLLLLLLLLLLPGRIFRGC